MDHHQIHLTMKQEKTIFTLSVGNTITTQLTFTTKKYHTLTTFLQLEKSTTAENQPLITETHHTATFSLFEKYITIEHQQQTTEKYHTSYLFMLHTTAENQPLITGKCRTSPTVEYYTTTKEPFHTTTVLQSAEDSSSKILPVTTEKYQTTTFQRFDRITSTQQSLTSKELFSSDKSPSYSVVRPTGEMETVKAQSDVCGVVNAEGTIAWVLVAIFVLLFFVLLTVNIVGACIYRRIHTRRSDNHNNMTAYEMEGNPCYEAVKVEQTSDMEASVYEGI